MDNAFNLGKVFGIQFRLHYTWFIIFILIAVSLSWAQFPSIYPGWTQLLYWVIGIVTSLLFFASVVAHELAHSLVARIYGIPVKSITLFIFGGIAHISREATSPGAELRMSTAGPACSIVIGGLFFSIQILTLGISEPIAAMAFWLARINLILAAFNLIPGFPLDGGRVFRSLLWHFTGNYKLSTRIATQLGQGVGYLFILGGILIMFLLPRQWLSGLWLAFIGWFLGNAASASYRQAQWREALHGFSASQVMTPGCPEVPSNITVNQLVHGYVFTSGHRFFLVADEGGLKGILTLHNIKSISQQNWDMTQVKEIMTPVDKVKVAHPNQDALSILEQMNECNINQIPVVSEGRVIGLIARDNLISFLRNRSELGM
ncbi:MAG: site-2 protease family protein [Dehalococcoidales bacterium]|nr:site-2 protease family protein [Dehalococcoidales bacterium]